MIEITFYKDSFYEELKAILEESKMFDEVWEARESLKKKISRDPQSILVAVEDEKIIGCIFIVEDGRSAFLWRLCVRESSRKKGVGSLLLVKSEEIIKSRGIKEVSLFANPKNNSLLEWYKGKNYLESGDWKFMYKKL